MEYATGSRYGRGRGERKKSILEDLSKKIRGVPSFRIHHEEGKPAEILEASEEELLAQIGREAEVRLGMSLEEFVEKYRRGELPDTPAVDELGILLGSAEGSLVRA